MTKRTITMYDREGDELEAPAKWAICGVCRGEGKRVNPAIDGNGISTDSEIWQDDDFRDNYLHGLYDVQCNTCEGTGKELVFDEEAAGPELTALHEWYLHDKYESEAVDRSEARAFRY